jgi:glutaredoxin 3
MRKIYKINMVLALILAGISFSYLAYIYNHSRNWGEGIMHQEIKAEITLYTKPSCIFCKKAKSFLGDLKLHFKEIDVSNKPSMHRKLVEQTGSRTVPYIFINDTFIGGYTDMLKMAEEGTLEKMLVM